MKALLMMVVCCLAGLIDVQACSCVGPPAPLTAVTNSAAVFTGKVLSVRETFQILRVGQGDEAIELRMPYKTFAFEIAAVVKGGIPKTIEVTTASTGGACGYAFEVGQSYLVYAHKLDDATGALGTSICSRTKLLDGKGKQELEQIMPKAAAL